MEKGVYTICSAIIERDNKVLLKRTEKGLSLLGGHINWGLGPVRGLIKKVAEQHKILIGPYLISGIYQNFSPSGKWITNICYRSDINYDAERKENLIWTPIKDIISGKSQLRTPDVKLAIRDLFNTTKADISFAQYIEGNNSPIDSLPDLYASTESIRPNEITVGSSVINYAFEDKYLLARKPDGLLTLLGGKIDLGEGLHEGIMRESLEEGGVKLKNMLGLIGTHTKTTESGRQVTNISSFSVINEEPKIPQETLERQELVGLEWFTEEQLRKMKLNEFRTPDTIDLIRKGIRLLRQKSFVPLSLVKEVEIN